MADITLAEDVTAIEITQGLNCSEVIYYFKSITYNTELNSGTTNESIRQWYNGVRLTENLPFSIKAGTKTSPETYYSIGKYNAITGEMYGFTSNGNTNGNLQVRNISFPISSKINTIKLEFNSSNRWWASGSTLIIYGR